MSAKEKSVDHQLFYDAIGTEDSDSGRNHQDASHVDRREGIEAR